MPVRRFALLVLAGLTALTACGSSGESDTGAASVTATSSVTAVASVSTAAAAGDGVGSLGDAVEVAAAAPAQAVDAACTIERRTLEVAVEAFWATNGSPPASQQQLVDAQFLREPSERFKISADGDVVAAPAGGCR